MSKSKQLAVNTIIVGLSKVSSVFAIFLVLPIYTKHLTAEQYGYFDLVIAYGLLIVPVVMLRLEVAIFRWLVDARGKEREIARIVTDVFQVVLLSILLFSVIYWFIASIVSLQYPWLVYGYLIFAVLSGIMLQISRGLGKIKQFAIGGVIAGVCSMTIGAALLIFFDMKLDGVLWGLVIGYGIAVVYNFLAVRLWQYIRGETSHELKRDLISFSLPMIPNGLAGWATLNGTRAIVSAMLGAAANGIYAVSLRFTTLFGGLYEVFNTTWSESASIHIEAKDRDEFFSKTIDVALRFFGSAAIGFIAVMPVIFPFLVDDSFMDAYWYIPVLTAAFLLDVVIRMIGAIYVALRLTKQVMYLTMTAAAISLLGTVVLIPVFGLWGAVIASATAFLVTAVHRYYHIRRQGIKIHIKIRTIVLLLVAYGLVSTVYYNQEWGIGVQFIAICAAVGYALALNRVLLYQLYTNFAVNLIKRGSKG